MNDFFWWTGVLAWCGLGGAALAILALGSYSIVTDLGHGFGKAFGTAFRLARLGSDKGGGNRDG